MNKEAILLKLEEGREQLLTFVNTSIDALIDNVKNGESIVDGQSVITDTVYPLGITPALFKGTKPTAIFFGKEKVEVKTWRKVYTLILQRCAAVPEKRDALMYLRGKISGRDRFFLSDKPDGMNVPIKIAEELYAEGYFDTEWLLKVLTADFLDVVRYDYSNISVSVVAGKRW